MVLASDSGKRWKLEDRLDHAFARLELEAGKVESRAAEWAERERLAAQAQKRQLDRADAEALVFQRRSHLMDLVARHQQAQQITGSVGRVDGTDAFVSVIVTHTDTEANDAGAVVTVELVDGVFRGDFTDAAGSVHGFDTVEAAGDAGLYEVDDEDAAAEGAWAAWVVDNDGNERGAFLRSGTFQATPRLSSTNFRLSRFSVTNGVIQMNGIVAPNN